MAVDISQCRHIGVLTLSLGFSVHAQSQKSENASATPATANSCPKGTVAQHNHNMERAAGSGGFRTIGSGRTRIYEMRLSLDGINIGIDQIAPQFRMGDHSVATVLAWNRAGLETTLATG